ncbi:unnamed protein product, partial [Choristocarpus tenellus]
FKYIGLQYSEECFCGDSYFSDDQPAVASDGCNMPCLGNPDLLCGGSWTNSVYDLGDPSEETEENDSNKGNDEVPRRQFTVTNNCNEMVRLGSTGGFVTWSDQDCPDGSIHDPAVGACFWALPLPEDGKTYDIAKGNSITIIMDHVARDGVRWSGNFWGATGCDRAVGCETAYCLDNTGYPDGYCPASTGPIGPVTKAEFTLVDIGVDYYDISVIDGVNLPMSMSPNPKSSPSSRDDD